MVVLAVLFGALSGGQMALRLQALVIGRLMASLSHHTALGPAVRGVLGEVADAFHASQAALVLLDGEERATAMLWLWAREDKGGGVAFSHRSLSDEERHTWFSPLPDGVTACVIRKPPEVGGAPAAALALAQTGDAVPATFTLPSAMARDLPWCEAMFATVEASERWSVRLLVFDPRLRPTRHVQLAFLQSLATQIGPPLLNLYLLRELRAAAASKERARVARELHDGATQTMLGLEMRLDVLRRKAEAVDQGVARELGELQDIARAGTADLRELADVLRPATVDGRGLGVELEDLVRRFRRNNGIDASFEWAAGRIALGHRQSHDAYRLAQEALANVRRHSGATRVRVRMEADASGALLIVEDNGKGLGFEGHLSHEELSADHKGPRVLRERLDPHGRPPVSGVLSGGHAPVDDVSHEAPE